MQASDLRNNINPSSLRRSLRNRPTRLLYQPPARRCADNQLKSSSPTSPNSPTSPKSPTIMSERHSNNFCSPEMTESKREILFESKDAKEPEKLASSSSQEDFERASYTRLKPTDQCLSGRKRGLGRGKLLKLQLLYESRYVKIDRMNDAVGGAHVQILDNAGPLPNLSKSADLNHNNNNNNHIRKPFLGISSSDSQSLKFQDATPPENDFEPFMYENKVSCQNHQCQTGISDVVPYVSKEPEWRMGGDRLHNMTKFFGSGDWEPKAEVSPDQSPFSRQKSLRAQNDYSSLPDYNSNFTFSNGDSKDMSKNFYMNNKTEDEESVDVFYSQTSSLSDETYLTVSSHVSDLEEITEGMSRSTDGYDLESVLSESISWTECLSQDSSADVISPSAKTSLNDSQDENKESSESSLSFQEEAKEEVINSVDCRDRIVNDVNYQAGDNQNWGTACMENPIIKKEFSAHQPKLSPRSDKCQRSNSSEIRSPEYSLVWFPNSDQKSYVSFCPSTTNYQSRSSYSQQPLITFENLSSPCRSSLPSKSPFFSPFYNKENIPNELAKDVSCERVTRTERSPWSGTKSRDCFVDAFRSRFKEISFTNQDRWKDSALQYRKVMGNEFSQEWKERYKRKCAEAGHKFLDTHCHIDMMFNEHLDRIYGTFQEYREAHADSFPEQFGGCVAIFCNPLTFNPRGSLFRSLLNENNVWIAVGCHPKKVKFLNNRTLQHLNECIRMPQVVAVGEIGLDYSGMFHLEADIQKRVFRAQIALALDVSKPIVIHCRDAEDDCFNILREECPLDWLIHLHCYMLDFEHAKRWLNTFPNLYIGLTPKVTFRNAADVQDTASKIPLNRLVLESDAPYFIPSMVPYNQLKCSHPGLVFTVAEKVAKLQVRDVREVLKACWDNSHRLYRINPAS